MTWRVEISDFLPDSVAEYSRKYGVSADQLRASVTEFVAFKLENPTTPFASSDDKPSGLGRNKQPAFQPYIANNIHHCHLDYVNADPMIVYRVIEAEKTIRVICIADHREMFSFKQQFAAKIASELPRSKARK